MCSICFAVFLVFVNRVEARACEQRWDITFQRHLEVGHIELADLGPTPEEQQQKLNILKLDNTLCVFTVCIFIGV